MDYKSMKLYTMIRQFDKASGKYEINGIEQSLATYLYRRAGEAFIPIPKGNYRISTESNNLYLNVDEEVNSQAVEFQIIYESKVIAEKYEDKFPELAVLVQKYNNLVDGVNNIITHIKTTGIKADSLKQTQILTPLEPLSVWYMTKEGTIDTLPIDDFNQKFKDIIEKITGLADVAAKERVAFYSDNLEKKAQEVVENIGTIKAKAESTLSELANGYYTTIEQKKDSSLKEIGELKQQAEESISTNLQNATESISNLKQTAETSISEQEQEVIAEIQRKKSETENSIGKLAEESKVKIAAQNEENKIKINAIAGWKVELIYIQDVGEKIKGNFYLDKQNGKMFECIKNTTSVTNDIAFFKESTLNKIIQEQKYNERKIWDTSTLFFSLAGNNNTIFLNDSILNYEKVVFLATHDSVFTHSISNVEELFFIMLWHCKNIPDWNDWTGIFSVTGHQFYVSAHKTIAKRFCELSTISGGTYMREIIGINKRKRPFYEEFGWVKKTYDSIDITIDAYAKYDGERYQLIWVNYQHKAKANPRFDSNGILNIRTLGPSTNGTTNTQLTPVLFTEKTPVFEGEAPMCLVDGKISMVHMNSDGTLCGTLKDYNITM